jgi:ribonuclease P protein component
MKTQVCLNAFSRELRLLTPSEYSNVFNRPIRISSEKITVLITQNNKKHPRLGLAISKKSVKLAYQRNLIKRVIRDSFRRHQQSLPPIDMVAISKKGTQELSSAELHQVMIKLWLKIKKRYNAS